jgi:hypothetical protein
MAKAMCIQNFSSGEGVAYESGVEYDVPAATLKANPNYFKQSGKPSNKMSETTEDKSADNGGESEAAE